MRRRDFVSASAALVAWPRGVQAQSVPRLAIVVPAGSFPEERNAPDNSGHRAFYQELRRLGWRNGENLLINVYSAAGSVAEADGLAKQVVAAKPNVIYVQSARLVLKLKQLTSDIPIVAITADPVGFGIVPDLARPGGNITGVTADAGLRLVGKHLEFLAALVPGLKRVGWLGPAAGWDQIAGRVFRDIAAEMGLTAVAGLMAGTIDEKAYERTFDDVTQQQAQGIVVGDFYENTFNRRTIVRLAAEHKLPATYTYRVFVDIGGLASYGPDSREVFTLAVRSIDRVLRGEDAGKIPFFQPTSFNFYLNMKTARQLGVEVPPQLLARADEVIE